MFPTSVLQRCGEFSEAVFRLGINGLLQSTFLIALGLAVGRAVRSKGAAVQSAVYRLTLATALACPVVSLLLATVGVPGMYFNLSIMPRPAGAYVMETALVSTAVPRVGPPANCPPVAVSRAVRGSPDPAQGSTEGLQAIGRPSVGWSAGSGDPRRAQHAVDVGGPAEATLETPYAESSLQWPLLLVHGLVVVWFLGASLLLVRLYFGWRLARWLRRTASPADQQTVAHCLALAERLGIRVPQVLRTPFSSSPLLLGVIRPVVLLPDENGDVTGREALVHELAHLARGDTAWGLLGRLGTALWFFQPLVWLLVRRMVVSAEEVCDDYVLDLGFDRPGYARRLVDIAEQYRPAPAIGVGMISLRSWVGRRVARILDSSRQLSLYAGRRALGVAIAASLTATILVALVGIGREPADAAPAETAMETNRADVTRTRPDASTPQLILASAASQPTATGHGATEITVRGKVLSPDGQPLSGATVRAGVGFWAMLEPIVGPNAKLPVSEAQTDANGQFTVSFTSQPYGDLSRLDRPWQDIWKETNIAASAPGYGAAWVRYKDIQPERPLTLRLVPDVPIKGRVVNAKGEPVAGMVIEVGHVWAAKDENLAPWLAGIKAGQLPWIVVDLAPREIEPALVGVPKQVKTDEQGRFEIHGVGRERHLGLTFKSETVAYRQFDVVTRKMEAIERVILGPWDGRPASKKPIYGAEFTVTAAPSRPVVGVVRDAKTRKPLAGVSVESYAFADDPRFGNIRVLKATTDADGRYRLIGMPKGKGNEILTIPNDDQPYLMRRVKLSDPEGLGPVSADVELHRGIWITGRVTDKSTGQPVRARLHYLPFRSNPFAQATPEFGKNFSAEADQMRYQSRADGSYRLVGLPGRAIVGAESVLRQYRQGVGSDRIQGPKQERHFDTYANPITPGPAWPNVMKEIDPPAEAESVTVDLQMDPGQTVRVAMVDPDGQPIGGVKVDGAISSHGRTWTTVDEPTFDVVNLFSGETRTLVFHHEARRLGLVTQIKADASGPQPITVRLLPVGILKGRLLSPDGAAATGANVEALVLPTRDFANSLPPVTTDAQGRFQYTLLPGVNYRLRIEGGKTNVDFVEGDLSVKPNEVRDLGEVTLRRRN